MGTTLEVYDGGYNLLVGPPGPSDSVQVPRRFAPAPRAVGDIWIDRDEVLASWDANWIVPTLLNGWVNYDAQHAPARYRKLISGLVVIEGVVKNGSGNFFILPVGYRPVKALIFSQPGNSLPTRVDIYNDGAVYLNVGTNTWVSLCLNFYPGA